MSALISIIMTATSEAGWLIYHEPKFTGKILDIDTKQPIEGVVVVIVYKKENMGLGGGNISSVINVQETLTDKDGNFHFPSYRTLIQPFSWQIPSFFVIFKPGYASLGLVLKEYFKDGEPKEHEGSWPDQELRKFKYRVRYPNIVELPKLTTREERLTAKRIYIEDYSAKELPLLYKTLDEEGMALGVK